MGEWKDLIEDGYLQVTKNDSSIELKNSDGKILSIACGPKDGETCYTEICNIFAEAGKWVIGLDAADINDTLFHRETGAGHYLKWNPKDEAAAVAEEINELVNTIKNDKQPVAAFIWGYGDMSIVDFTSAVESLNIYDEVEVIITLAFVENEEASIHVIIA